MKNLIAAASCWLLRKDFSVMDVLYASLAALTASDYGFWSAELLTATIVIFVFHYLFCRLTVKIRISHQIRRILKPSKALDRKNAN